MYDRDALLAAVDLRELADELLGPAGANGGARMWPRVAAGPRPRARGAGAARRGPGDDDPPPIGDPGPDDGEPDDDDFDDDDFDDEDAVEAAPARGPRDVV